jgi:hypothetical protein
MDKTFLTIEYFLKNFNEICKKYTWIIKKIIIKVIFL